MKIAIFSDIHANLPAFTAALQDSKKHNCERIYHAGDLISIGPYPAEVVELAESENVQCVLGNHEQWVIHGLPLKPSDDIQEGELRHQHWIHSRLSQKHCHFIRSMPYHITDTVEGVRLQIQHFALLPLEQGFKVITSPNLPENEILRLFERADIDLICFGHIHPRKFNSSYHGCHFLNPGSVGCSHDSHASYAIVDLSSGKFEIKIRYVYYDRNELLEKYDLFEIPDKKLIKKCFFGVK